ncbi:UDP-N-acetylmuramate dehydrogenase [Longimicrobium terrae]|uniref:UDP-N-acetylenolpyruvoylglucosamine reductase n=1 Tax=Longimicrobium terrae TaxID=1639882 RepID=A0A841H252_9BACT|nr:UDP-N-acetylmuramate dehydrogenase [Longimicrobium terrae]MBB4637676.1 UDP-N-acetylmuramate dehydrogenase [Longimicrobium terrae]MBB6072073.1 UDP-N-acetylmuramate dehydrogenase [Longimicrobium terrae]NNC29843.1 UDP-N-acetylmuramate dehydrogenase [Longimicrobium terrae]
MSATKALDLPVSEIAARLGDDRLERDAILAPHTTFKIGGPADLLYRALNQEELAEAVRTARDLDIPFFLLGLGANILVGDKGFRGLVIKNEVEHVEWLDDTRVKAGSGVKIYHDLIQMTVAKGLGGLQHYVGIPSTVGGAVWQNLHFLSPPPERERTMFIAEVVEGATILTEEGEVREVDLDYFQFGYDYSILHDRKDVVLDVTFRLEPTPKEEMRETIRENLQWRDDRHPDLWLYPSAGSIFQKLEGIGAGRLVDQVGLKGHVLGSAQIFHKHANIMVNLGGATSADVRALIDLAQTRVREQLGYELKTEIGMIGEF